MRSAPHFIEQSTCNLDNTASKQSPLSPLTRYRNPFRNAHPATLLASALHSQKEVLNGLKNWFYGLDKVDEDDGGEDVTEMESYIMSLSDVLRGTRAAAKKLDDHTLKSTEKLGEVMKSLRRAYNDALNPKFKTIVKGGDDGPAVEVEDPSLQIIALEKNLRDAQFELMAGKEAFERERKELNKRLEKADGEVSAFLEQNNLSSSDHREQIHALKKKVSRVG